MKSLLAILIATCTAVWVYGSLRYYNCIKSDDCSFSGTYANIEIIIMLLGAFIFGYIFGNILSSLKQKKYIKRSQLDNLKTSYSQSKKYGLYETKSKVDKNRDISSMQSNVYMDTNAKKVDNSHYKENLDNFNLGEKEELTVKKKGLFGSFLDDIDFNDSKNSKETLTQNIIVDKEKHSKETKKSPSIGQLKNLSSNKSSPKYSNTDESLMKIHKKNNKDDLTKIEGIGPKIEDLLNQSNIYSFADLATTDPYILTDILSSAGTRFQMHNPKTWPKQATLAKNNEWLELKQYQQKLNGGKE